MGCGRNLLANSKAFSKSIQHPIRYVKPDLSQILGIKKNCFHELNMLRTSPVRTEFFIARAALFRKKRLAICNFRREHQKTCAASSNDTSKHADTIAKYDGGARGTREQLSSSLRSFVLHKEKCRIVQRPHFTSPNFCFHEMFMKFSSPICCFQKFS